MSTCEECGSRCRGRYCSICGPMVRQTVSDDGLSPAQEARVSRHGPHHCDICDRDFATRQALREHDCALADGGESGAGAVQKEWVILDDDEVVYGPTTELQVRREHDHGDYPDSAEIIALPEVHGGIQL